ncbi:MAG: hypothetical protein ONB16_04665 [candidate division KSB1 bacterium]|nr:hypothetical protein [candidate division KSB1 bacterium]MDZ7318747.1 hypothetical protein [candidate division KSB1 bacterium]MDZ7340801.1 hypothetical protein [candidate division KSB1 bacterium]
MDWILEKWHSEELEQRIKNYRRISELLVILFFILLYLFLKNTRVPHLNVQLAETYKKIDWTRYIPEQARLLKKHQVPAPVTHSNNAASNQAAANDRIEVVDSELLNSDLSTILNQQPNRSLQNIPERKQPRELAYHVPTSAPDLPNFDDAPREFLPDHSPNLLPRTFVEPKNVGPTVAVNDVAPNHETAGKSKRYPMRTQPGIDPNKVIPQSGVIEIPLISNDKAHERRDLSVIIDELMLWMRRHPHDFNAVTRTFMMYEKGDLTSRVVFKSKNRVFELYLLYKEKSKEIRICLIEGDQSTMLIDSGFKKQSNYLRTGFVARQADETIFSFGTTQYPASERTTAEFYQVFLSWWDQAKLEKQRD